MRRTPTRLLLVPSLVGVLVLGLVGCSTPEAATGPAGDAATLAPSSPSPEQSGAEQSGPASRRVPRSEPPRLPYVDGRVLRMADGATLDLPGRWGVSSIEAYAGGYLVTDDRFFEGTVGMHRLDGEGRVLESWGSTGAPVASRDGRLAWMSLVAPESGRSGPTLLHVDAREGGRERTQELERAGLPLVTGWFRGEVVLRTWGEPFSSLTDLASPPRPVPLAQELGVPGPGGRRWASVTSGALEVRQGDGVFLARFRQRGLGATVVPGLVWEDERFVLTTLVRGARMCLARIDTEARSVRGAVSCTTPWRRVLPGGMPALPAR